MLTVNVLLTFVQQVVTWLLSEVSSDKAPNNNSSQELEVIVVWSVKLFYKLLQEDRQNK